MEAPYNDAGLGLGSLVSAPVQQDTVFDHLPNPDKFKAPDQVHAEYQQWLTQNPNGAPVDLPTWAKGMDMREGTPYRGSVYNDSATYQDWVKKYNAGTDNALYYPAQVAGKVGQTVGEGADKVFGTGNKIAQVGEQVGESFPRTMLSSVGGPGGMIADAGLNRYGQTGSLGQAAESAALTGATLGAAHVGGNLAEDLLSKNMVSKIAQRGATPESLDAVSTGMAPKLAHAAGAVAGGVAGQELSNQVQAGGQNPFTVQNIASDVMGGATMAVPEAVGVWRNASELNLRAQSKLADWANEQAAKNLQSRGFAPTDKTPVNSLINQSVSVSDMDPNWRKNFVLTSIGDLNNVTDPAERAARVSRVAIALGDSRNIDSVTNAAERDAKMAYIKPPQDIVGLTDLARRVNVLKEDALARLDEMAQGGDEKAVSAAGYRQLEAQGFIKDKIDLDWLSKRFGTNVERSLTNSNANAYLMLTQQLANEMMILADTGKTAREGVRTQQSIEAPGMSKSLLDDRYRVANFVDALSKVGTNPASKDMLSQLYDRFTYHEGEDNVHDTGSANRFMDEVTQVVNQIAAGKDPATIDWNTEKTQLEKRVSVSGEQGEERPVGIVQRGLSDYLAKNFNGDYTTKVYGRPNRSQRETLMTDLANKEGQNRPIESGSQEAKSEQELYGVPKDKASPVEQVPQGQQAPTTDWAEHADKVRQYVDASDPRVLWTKILAPELMNARGRVDPRVAMRVSPIAKDLVQAIFEMGPLGSSKENAPREVGPAGKQLLASLGKTGNTSADLSNAVRDILAGGSRNAGDVMNGVVKRIGQEAGINPDQPKANQASLGASQTMYPELDAHRVFQTFFRRMGYEPELVDHFTKLSMQTVLNFRDSGLDITKMSPDVAYAALNRSYDSLMIGGGYWNKSQSPTGRPLIALALDHAHDVGANPKSLVAWHAISTLAHELIHDVQAHANEYDGLTPPTAYSKERIGAYRQLERAAMFYTPEQKYNFLKSMAEATIPKDLLYKDGKINPNIDGNLKYGSGQLMEGTPDYEFVNVFGQVAGLGMLTGGTGKINPDQVFTWMPEEQALFAKGYYRDLHDNLSSVFSAISDPKFREAAGLDPLKGGPTSFLAHQTAELIKATHRMMTSEEPQKSAAQAQGLLTALEGKTWEGPITQLAPMSPFTFGDKEMMSRIKASQSIVKDMQMMLFGDQDRGQSNTTPGEPTTSGGEKPPKENQMMLDFPETSETPRAQVNMSKYWRYLGLFQQGLDHMTRRGIPLGADIASTVRELIPTQNRTAMNLWSPFMTKDGKFDPSHPLIEMTTDHSIAGRRDRAVLNKILEWQQGKEKDAVEQDKQGNWGLTKEAQQSLKYTDLPQRVIGAVKAMSDVGNRMGITLLDSRVDSAANRTARMLMAIQPKELGDLPYDIAKTDASKIVQGLLYNQQRSTADGLMRYPEPIRETVLNMLNGGILDGLKQLQNQVQSRTWWMTEQRPGSHLVVSYDKDGVRHVDGAESAFQARRMQKQLSDKGYQNISVVDKAERGKIEGFDSPENVLRHFIDLEQESWDKYLTQNPQQLTPEQISTLREYGPSIGSGVEQSLERRGTNKFLIQRQRVPSALGMDYVDNMRDYIGRLSGTVSRQAVQQKLGLVLNDARMKGQNEFATFVRDNVRQMMTPASELERSSKAFSTAYFIAGHLSSAVVIGTHAMNTLPETLIDHGGKGYGIFDAGKHVTQSLHDLTFMRNNPRQVEMLNRSASQKIAAGQKLTGLEAKAYLYTKALADKVLDKGFLQDLVEDQDYRTLAAKQFGTGKDISVGPAKLAGDGLYRVSRASMLLPRMASSFNNNWAFMSGVNQALEKGLSVDDAFRHADNIRTTALFAGGKTNLPGWIGRMTNENSVGIARTMHTLQQFGYGLMGRYMEHLSNTISTDPNLPEGQRGQALKAAGTLVLTQLAFAGLMGLPGVAASMAIAEKMFGVQAETAVRKGLAHLAGADDDNSGFRGLMTETALNGIPNQVLGVNIGSRLGVADFLGTSSYDGFNLSDLAGPAGSIAYNMVSGLGYLAQGEPKRGFTTLAPNVFKRPVEMAFDKMRFGDYGFRDPMGRPVYNESNIDTIKRALGFMPNKLAEKQHEKYLIDLSNKEFAHREQESQDSAAQALLRGDRGSATQLATQQMLANPSIAMRDPTQPMRHLADRAVELQQQSDPLASGPVENASSVKQIAQTFPAGTAQRRSEMQVLQQKLQAETAAGAPPKDVARPMSRAVMIDAFVEKGMTKPEAERMVEMMGL